MKAIRILKRIGVAVAGLLSPELVDVIQTVTGSTMPATVEDAIKNIVYGILFLVLLEIRAPKDEHD